MASEKKQTFIADNAFVFKSKCAVDISTHDYHIAHWVSWVSGQVARKAYFYAYSMLQTLLLSAAHFFLYTHVRSVLSLMKALAVRVLKVPNCHGEVSVDAFNFLTPYLCVAILSCVFSSCLSFC